jgi:hypothetical protein
VAAVPVLELAQAQENDTPPREDTPLITRNRNSTMTYGCWLGKAFELAFEFGEDGP